EVAGDALPVSRALVDVEHRLTQVDALQPGEHGVDGGAFLGDEQYLAAPGHQGGDQVGDGLALAGARRSVDHQAVPGQHRADRAALRGVGVQDRVVLVRRVEHGLGRVVAVQQFLRLDVAGDGGDHIAVAEQVTGGFKVTDHGQLGV